MLSAALVSSPAFSTEQAPRQVWDGMRQQLSKNTGLIAYQIATSFEAPGDDGPETGQYSTRVNQLDKEGNPLREHVAGDKKSYKFDAMSLSLAILAANRPEEFLLSPSTMVFIRDDMVDGEAASVYEVKSSVGKGTYPVLAQVWIRQGMPLKIDGVVEKLPLPGIKKAAFSLLYTTGENGLSLPKSLQVNYTISIFFHTGQVSFQHNFSDWKRKP